MAIKDLRSFISVLEEHGELVRVKAEVDWNLELGGILRRIYDKGAPAALFEKIKDYPKGMRILGAPMGRGHTTIYSRHALALGLKPDAGYGEILKTYVERKNKPFKPVVVKNAPCKEVILKGDDVDLLKFPVPFIHEGDGGRFIGTWHAVVSRDPEEGWTNWGMYRMMVHDRNTTGMLIPPIQHMGRMYQKAEAMGKPLEAAVALGTDPATTIVSCAMLPDRIEEQDVAGGLLREPMELVKCETVDLSVPANAEIILEGYIPPGERRTEGPFGEYMGFEAGRSGPRPVFHVTCFTHRKDPILAVSNMGMPIHESQVVMGITMAGDIYDELTKQGLPIRMAYMPPYGVTHMIAVSTQTPYMNFAKRVAHSIWGTKAGSMVYYVIVCDADVDVTDFNQVIHSIATKCHPSRGIYQVPHAPSYAYMVPFLNDKERPIGDGAYALLDCTWPKDWPKETIPVKSSFDVLWPKEIQDKVIRRWEDYGFAKD